MSVSSASVATAEQVSTSSLLAELGEIATLLMVGRELAIVMVAKPKFPSVYPSLGVTVTSHTSPAAVAEAGTELVL